MGSEGSLLFNYVIEIHRSSLRPVKLSAKESSLFSKDVFLVGELFRPEESEVCWCMVLSQ